MKGAAAVYVFPLHAMRLVGCIFFDFAANGEKFPFFSPSGGLQKRPEFDHFEKPTKTGANETNFSPSSL